MSITVFPSKAVLDKRLAAAVHTLEAGTYLFERHASGEIVAVLITAGDEYEPSYNEPVLGYDVSGAEAA